MNPNGAWPLLILRVINMVVKGRVMGYQDSESSLVAKFVPAAGDAHLVIGALFPIHKKSNTSDNCGRIWPEYGIHRVETALQTIRYINDNAEILPGLKLGIEIRDSCWTERVAVEQTIAMLRDSMGGSSGSCETSESGGSDKIVAVVGPGSSDNSKAVHNLLQIFSIPQVGYSATSIDLSNKKNYKFYQRVVPSDKWQARAFVDIVKHFNWTYVFVLYSEGSYGQKGFEAIEELMKKEDAICLAGSERISKEPRADGKNKYEEIVKNLAVDPKPFEPAKVVICFCIGDDVKQIFDAIKRLKKNQPGNETMFDFQIIGSESVADRTDVVQDAKEVAHGMISLRIYTTYSKEFDDYFLRLTPTADQVARNPWFDEFWEQQFNCTLPGGDNSQRRWYDRLDFALLPCSDVVTNLSLNHKQDTKLTQVRSAILTVAKGLDAMRRDLCIDTPPDADVLCDEMKPAKFNGTMLFHNYMLNVHFMENGLDVHYDDHGDPPARYDIMNYQTDKYVRIGEWNSGSATNGTTGISITKSVQFYTDDFLGEAPESVCSKPCAMGFVKKVTQKKKCCWTCMRCSDKEFVLDEETCQLCEKGKWPTADKSGCVTLEIEYLRNTSPLAVCAIALASVGIVVTLFTTFTFILHNHTPVVKATTRELSYIVLSGILICYLTTYVIVLKPTRERCYLLRTLPGLAFSMMYGALLTKTNRIARILSGSKKRILTKKPRFLSTTSQVVMTGMLVGIEATIIISLLVYQPADATMDYSRHRRVLLVCNTTSLAFLAPFGFDLCLIALCTLYAIKTRNLPENFNEAKFIGFTMYTTCVIWLAFVTIYFGSDSKSITMCFCFSLSATVQLVLLYFPKLYIIIFEPHKNVRSSFATSKVIRCHFGTTPSQISATGDSFRFTKSDKGRVKFRNTSEHDSQNSGAESGSDSFSGSQKRRNQSGSIHIIPPPAAAAKPVTTPTSPLPDGVQAISANLYIPQQDSQMQAFKIRAQKGKPELSVIHESELSSRGSIHVQISDKHNVGVQTDPRLMERFIREWMMDGGALQHKKTREEPSRPYKPRKRSQSQRGRQDSTVSSSDGVQDGSSPLTSKFKRTLSEYNKFGKTLAGKPIRSKKPTSASEPRFSLLSQTSSQFSSSREPSVVSQTGFLLPLSIDSFTQRRSSTDAMAESITTALKTVYDTSQAGFTSAPETGATGADTGTDGEPTDGGSADESYGEPGRMARSDSILARLGRSLKQRMRRMSPGTETVSSDSPTHSPTYAKRSYENLTLSQHSSVTSFSSQRASAVPRGSVIEEEEDLHCQGVRSRQNSQQTSSAVMTGCFPKQPSESQESDSGFLSYRPSDKTTSYNGSFSSKHSSAKSKHGSLRQHEGDVRATIAARMAQQRPRSLDVELAEALHAEAVVEEDTDEMTPLQPTQAAPVKKKRRSSSSAVSPDDPSEESIVRLRNLMNSRGMEVDFETNAEL